MPELSRFYSPQTKREERDSDDDIFLNISERLGKSNDKENNADNAAEESDSGTVPYGKHSEEEREIECSKDSRAEEADKESTEEHSDETEDEELKPKESRHRVRRRPCYLKEYIC